MQDQENGPSGHQWDRPPPRGVPVYAIESLVLSILELAWLTLPLSAGIYPGADRMLLLPLAVGGVANVVLCSVVSDNRVALGAYASLALTCAVAYVFVFGEAVAVPAYNRVFFGNAVLLQILAAVSLAFVFVHTLLALAAIHDRLWQQTAWIDVSLALLPCLLSVVCFDRGDAASGYSNAVASGLLLTASVVDAFAGDESIPVLRSVPRPFMFVLTRALAVCAAVVALATAYTAGLTSWSLLAHMCLLLFLLGCRSVGEWAELSRSRAASSDLQQVVPDGGVSDQPAAPPHPDPMHMVAQMHHRAHQGQLFFPHPVLRTPHLAAETAFLRGPALATEATLFAGANRQLRQQSKKRI